MIPIDTFIYNNLTIALAQLNLLLIGANGKDVHTPVLSSKNPFSGDILDRLTLLRTRSSVLHRNAGNRSCEKINTMRMFDLCIGIWRICLIRQVLRLVLDRFYFCVSDGFSCCFSYFGSGETWCFSRNLEAGTITSLVYVIIPFVRLYVFCKFGEVPEGMTIYIIENKLYS